MLHLPVLISARLASGCMVAEVVEYQIAVLFQHDSVLYCNAKSFTLHALL